jgi:hypothetical protein
MNALDQVSSPVVLLPAYGRQYASKHTAINDWRSGKDFKIATNGKYCSIRDLDLLNASSVWIDLVTSLVRVE